MRCDRTSRRNYVTFRLNGAVSRPVRRDADCHGRRVAATGRLRSPDSDESRYPPYSPYPPQRPFQYPAQMMTRDQELWGMAAMILRQHGDRAPVVVAERIDQLASEGKGEGVALWKGIARQLERLMAEDSSQ